jgi:hypothetical protein
MAKDSKDRFYDDLRQIVREELDKTPKTELIEAELVSEPEGAVLGPEDLLILRWRVTEEQAASIWERLDERFPALHNRVLVFNAEEMLVAKGAAAPLKDASAAKLTPEQLDEAILAVKRVRRLLGAKVVEEPMPDYPKTVEEDDPADPGYVIPEPLLGEEIHTKLPGEAASRYHFAGRFATTLG